MAAEITVPDRSDIAAQIRTLHDRLHDRTTRILQDARQRVMHLTQSRAFHEPAHRLQQRAQELDALIGRLHQSGRRLLDHHRHRLDRLRDRLASADPERPLRRGYVRVERDGAPVSSAQNLAPNDTITLQFLDGTRTARILPGDAPSQAP